MPFIYPGLLDRYKQIWVSNIEFEFPPVSSRGVTSGLSSWNGHSTAHSILSKPGLLGLSAQLNHQ